MVMEKNHRPKKMTTMKTTRTKIQMKIKMRTKMMSRIFEQRIRKTKKITTMKRMNLPI
jgi:hypothetical protein